MRVVALFIYPVVAAILIFALTTKVPQRVKYNGEEKYLLVKPDSVQVRNSATLRNTSYPASNTIDNDLTTGWAPGYNIENAGITQNEVKFIFSEGKNIDKILFASGNNSAIPQDNGKNFLKAKAVDIYINGENKNSHYINETDDWAYINISNGEKINTISIKPTDFYWGYGKKLYLVTEVQFYKLVPVDYDTVLLRLDQKLK